MYTAKIWVADTRAPAVANKKAPEGGWGNKSGRRKLSKDLQGKDPADLCQAIAELLGSKDEDKRQAIQRIQIDQDSATDISSLNW